MVNDVPKLCTEAELHSFSEVQVLVNRQVEVVSVRRLQGVPPEVGIRSNSRLDVLRIRIIGQIADYEAVVRTGSGQQAVCTRAVTRYQYLVRLRD